MSGLSNEVTNDLSLGNSSTDQSINQIFDNEINSSSFFIKVEQDLRKMFLNDTFKSDLKYGSQFLNKNWNLVILK